MMMMMMRMSATDNDNVMYHNYGAFPSSYNFSWFTIIKLCWPWFVVYMNLIQSQWWWLAGAPPPPAKVLPLPRALWKTALDSARGKRDHGQEGPSLRIFMGGRGFLTRDFFVKWWWRKKRKKREHLNSGFISWKENWPIIWHTFGFRCP